MDFAVAVGGEQTVLCQCGCADHAVQTYLTACGGSHPELRAGEGLAGETIPLLDNQTAFRLVLKGEGNGAALLDLHGLALAVDDKTGRGAGFRYYHALAGF